MTIFDRQMRGPMLLTAAMIAISCGAPVRKEPPPPLADCLMGERLGITDPSLGDPHGQGSELLGLGFMDAGTFVRVDRFDVNSVADDAGLPIKNVRITSRSLTGANHKTEAPLAMAEWKGAALVGQLRCTNPKYKGKTHNVRARILEVVPNSTPFGVLEHRLWIGYKLQLELEDGRHFMDVCHDKDAVAFPIPGYWNDAGAYVRDKTKFSFACAHRHVATCLKQGYLDSSDSNDRMALFEACTRMMRADYCGDGGSYTKDGTFISVWDNRDIATEIHREPLVFEAAWNKNGMVCSARPRWNEKAIRAPKCLQSKSRPICNSAKEAAALSKDPLVFNDSCVDHPCKVNGHEEPFDRDGDPIPPGSNPVPPVDPCPRNEDQVRQTTLTSNPPKGTGTRGASKLP
jgi:hypothetical protein